MSLAKASLTIVGDNIIQTLGEEWNGTITVQILGADTYTIDATLDEINWVTLLSKNANTGGATNNIVGAGLYSAEYMGYKACRLIKTVGVTAANCAMSIYHG